MPPPQSFLLLLLCLKPLPGIYIWTNSKGGHTGHPHAVISRPPPPPLQRVCSTTAPIFGILGWDNTTSCCCCVSSFRYERTIYSKGGHHVCDTACSGKKITKYCSVPYSILLHLPPLRFHYAGGCWIEPRMLRLWHWQPHTLNHSASLIHWTKNYCTVTIPSLFVHTYIHTPTAKVGSNTVSLPEAPSWFIHFTSKGGHEVNAVPSLPSNYINLQKDWIYNHCNTFPCQVRYLPINLKHRW
jgi:hypothetical protein